MDDQQGWERQVEVDLGPNFEWVAQMEWPEGEPQGGPAVLVIRPSDPNGYPAGGLSQTVLREVDFKYALNRLRSQLASSERWSKQRHDSDEKMTALLIDASDAGITEDYLALLSRAYVATVSQGQAKPLEHLAGITGKSASAIKNHLWQATRKGLLERSPGRAGGRVTEKAADRIRAILNVT